MKVKVLAEQISGEDTNIVGRFGVDAVRMFGEWQMPLLLERTERRRVVGSEIKEITLGKKSCTTLPSM